MSQALDALLRRAREAGAAYFAMVAQDGSAGWDMTGVGEEDHFARVEQARLAAVQAVRDLQFHLELERVSLVEKTMDMAGPAQLEISLSTVHTNALTAQRMLSKDFTHSNNSI